ncbi:hypothetical protein [Cryobacterium sp. PH31-O1]|uniref:hypothetical protein n=1 Tax=Cryobacterium sp. PH31-O1 TaxID=3046306 RepID=UPI0024B90A0F|nr:hypothetical protein [Cryobacterium sp. PH31-O1]MDJ0337545.1 hypothetical protein [Cryobacterium sp. PH31-O1]
MTRADANTTGARASGVGISGLNPPPAGITASTSRRMRSIRLVLVAIGVLLLAWGAFVMFDSVRLTRIPGVALWVGAAIVLHDAILAPIVFALGFALRRVGRRATGTVIAIVQSGIVVGSIVSLVAVPTIVAKNFAPANPTVLPLDYALNLGIFWLVLALVTVGLSVGAFLRWRQPVPALPDDSGR